MRRRVCDESRARRKCKVKRLIAAMGCALGCALAPGAMLHAQQWQPGPTVEFIVPAGPGAALDSAGREIQQLLREHDLVHSMVVINKPGGNSSIALAVLDQHVGDGNYLMTLTTSILNNHILGTLGKTYRDYTPLALLFREYIGLVVRDDSPFHTAQDLIRFMKDKPGALNIGVATSVGNHIHVGAALPLSKAGVKIDQLSIIPFKSSGESMSALLGGHIEVVAATTPNLIAAMNSGRLRVLAVGSPQRLEGQLAAVPTWREQGIDVVTSSVQGVLGPPGLTPAQIKYWGSALAEICNSAQWKEFLAKNQWQPHFVGPEQAGPTLDQEYREIKEVLVALRLAH